MIKIANYETTPLVKQMWKECFGDTDEFISLYFAKMYAEQDTLIYFEDDKAVASLQMLAGKISFFGDNITYFYMSGLCTLPEYRKKGYMGELIEEAHKLMHEQEIPFAVLVPAEEWLFDYYRRFDYEHVFEGNKDCIDLKPILKESTTFEEAFAKFNELQKSQDFSVQKNFVQFQAIVEDAKMSDYPDKKTLSAMVCITDMDQMLDLYKSKCGKAEITPTEDGLFKITHEGGEFDVDKKMLTRLLFGYKTSEINETCAELFPEHDNSISYMLE